MRASLKTKFSIVFDPKKIIVDITTPKIPIGILILSIKKQRCSKRPHSNMRSKCFSISNDKTLKFPIAKCNFC